MVTADKLELSPVKPGDVLAGKYRVESILGAGGMGVVAACRHLDLNELRAVKFLLPEAKTDEETVARFMREARAVVKLKNPHVVQVYDIGRFEGGEPYIVMEYLEGRDLKSFLKERKRLHVDEAVLIALQTLEAMAEAHSLGIVHRDLKPANIYITTDLQGELCVKVLDFGISKLLNTEDEGMEMTTTHALMGSPYYMSPEQMMSTRDVDARADIWSIGVVLFQMLAGRVPFRGKNIAAQCALLLQREPPLVSTMMEAPLPAGLDLAVADFLKRDVEKRYPSVSAAASALAPFCGHGEKAARRVASVFRRSHDRISNGGLEWGDTAKSLAQQRDAAFARGSGSSPGAASQPSAGSHPGEISHPVVSDDALTISTSSKRSVTMNSATGAAEMSESWDSVRSAAEAAAALSSDGPTRISSPGAAPQSGRVDSSPSLRGISGPMGGELPENPVEAGPDEVMSQSTKASWQTIGPQGEPPKKRRAGVFIAMAVAIGALVIVGAVVLRNTSEAAPTANAATSDPASSTASNATTAVQAAADPSPSEPGTTPEPAPEAPSAEPAASSPEPAESVVEPPQPNAPTQPGPRYTFPKPRPAPKADPKPVPKPKDKPSDPFSGREPLR